MLDIQSNVILLRVGKRVRLLAVGDTDIEGRWDYPKESLGLVLFSDHIPATDEATLISASLPCSRAEAKRMLKKGSTIKMEPLSPNLEGRGITEEPLIISVRKVIQ